jgi:putative ABC transport system permease protein
MLFDITAAVRSLRRQLVLSIAVVLTVGLAVAGNTALFSVFDGLLFRPLPYPDADRLMHVEVPFATRQTLRPDQVRALDTALETTPLFDVRGRAGDAVLLEDGAADVTEWRLRPAEITPRLLSLLGIVPAAGRLLSDDDLNVSPRRVMIGFHLWQTRFGGSRAALNTPVEIPGVILQRRLEIVGVMPAGMAFPGGANLWIAGPASGRANTARLAPNVTLEQARATLPRVEITPLREHLRPDGAMALSVLIGATACLLVVAWVQVAALLFARAAARTSEIGVRLALGASRGQLVRQFVAEGAVLAAGALALSWLIAPALTSALIHLLPDETTRGQALTPDGRTFLFSIVLSAAGVIVLSLVPAALVRRSSPLDLLRGGGQGRSTAGTARTRLGMLVAQLAVTTTLLYMSGLALRSFDAIAAVDLGFDPDRVVAVQLPPTTVVGSTMEERRAHITRQVQQWNETLEALRELPGIASAGGGRLPFHASILLSGAGMPVTSPALSGTVLADYGTMTPDYVRVMRLRVVEGRVPREEEMISPPQALGAGSRVVINQTMARTLAPGASAVGLPLTVNSRTVTVAAVVEDFKSTRPDLPVAPAVMLVQRRPQGGYVLARVADDVSMDQTLVAIRTTMDRIWPVNPSRDVMVVSDLAARAIADYRARALLLGLIGALCLPLAFAGVAGAASYAVAQRTREIAIRVALGARPAHIRQTVIGGGMAAVGVALLAGIAGGVLVGRAMSAFLFGVSAANAWTMAGVSAVLLMVALVAMWIPARRAMRVQAAEALRAV